MASLLREFLDSNKARQLADIRNIGLYIFTIVILAITWSGVKTVQHNYELQKKISTLQQQNTVTDLENGNIALQNQYYKTNAFLELSARQQLGLAAPGETVYLIPQSVAMKYIDKSVADVQPKPKITTDSTTGYAKNLETWRDFLLGHQLTVN